MSSGKLLRPLHRQRQRRRGRVAVLNSAELADHFDIEPAKLATYLQSTGIAYHTDSNGEIWASIKTA